MTNRSGHRFAPAGARRSGDGSDGGMSLRIVEEIARENVGPERRTPRPTGRNGSVSGNAGVSPHGACDPVLAMNLDSHSRAHRNDGQLSDLTQAVAGRDVGFFPHARDSHSKPFAKRPSKYDWNAPRSQPLAGRGMPRSSTVTALPAVSLQPPAACAGLEVAMAIV